MNVHRLLTPGWLLKHLFALIILLVLIRLGFWQLDRLAQKRALNSAFAAVLSQPAIPLPSDGIDPAAFDFIKVRVSGVFDNPQSMVLRNQTLDGFDGMHLLTPLRISGSDRAVIVDRGWLPEMPPGSLDLAAYAVSGEVTVEGIARRAQPRPDAALAPMDLPLPGETRINAWVRVDIDRMQTQIPYPLLPIFVARLPDDTTPPAALPRPPSYTTLDEGPHLTYAIQWFIFSGVLVVGYALLIRQELRK